VKDHQGAERRFRQERQGQPDGQGSQRIDRYRRHPATAAARTSGVVITEKKRHVISMITARSGGGRIRP
jgi:hypothetical protein